ncbi:site-specific integrase [Siminovitchia terrae]|uniref:Site-specific integrase n=1 Tax=Siminovitchia terrae TaxID=1914933 RepID=A0A429X8C4_SIMTE|nr:site-specific integrase [Siminovitchia terrae]RST59677.1 site-specific integrase [Siminovitchia terrae]
MASFKEVSKGRYRLYVELGYDAEGKRKRKTKTVQATGPRQVKKLLQEFEMEVLDSQHLEDENPTFSDFLERWKSNYAETELSASTLEKYNNVLKYMKPYFKGKRMKDISTFHIVQYFTKERKAGRGSLEKKYNLLQSLFKYAVKWRIIDDKANPIEGVDRPKAKKKKVDFYDKEEIELLFKLAKELLPYQQLIIKLAVTAGLRRGEILALADDVLDFPNRKIHIKRSLQYTKEKGHVLKETKTEEERTVTIPEVLMKEIHKSYVRKLNLKMEMGTQWKGFKGRDSKKVMLLFSDECGIPFRPDSVTQFWNRFMIRHNDKIKRIRFHDLRHSSASLILSEGVNMKVVQKRLGHKNIKTTLNIYSHVTEKDDEEASNVFDQLF